MCISIFFFIYKKLIFQLREFTVDTKAFVMLYYDFVVYFSFLIHSDSQWHIFGFVSFYGFSGAVAKYSFWYKFQNIW